MKSKDLLLIKNQMEGAVLEIRYLSRLVEQNNTNNDENVYGKFPYMNPKQAFKSQYGIEIALMDDWIEDLVVKENA